MEIAVIEVRKALDDITYLAITPRTTDQEHPSHKEIQEAFCKAMLADFLRWFLSSTLSILRRKCERIHQALKEHSWDFYHIGFGR